MTEQFLVNELCRRSLYYFVRRAFEILRPREAFKSNWHINTMCHSLQNCATGDGGRLLITIPPRHLKSICTAVALPAWLLGRDPGKRILVASYGSELARDHARDFRNLIESDWYQELFPTMHINPRGDRRDEIITTVQGARRAVSRGGPVTGFGADLLIIDDLMKADEATSENARKGVKDFYQQSLLSRLDNKGTASIIAIQQRLHQDDLAAHLLETGRYEHLCLPAIAEDTTQYELEHGLTHTRQNGEVLFPAHESREVLDRLREELGSYVFSAQYQQRPTAPEGNLFRWEKIHTYTEKIPRNKFQKIVQSWDTGVSDNPGSDYSVCITCGYKDGKWYLLDVCRSRLLYSDLKALVTKMIDNWKPETVLIEKANSGMSLVSELRQENPEMRRIVRSVTPKTGKLERFVGETDKIENGRILFPTTAPWLEDFKNELLAFPDGNRHDDQVDALSQFLRWSGRHDAYMAQRDPVTGRPLGRRRL